jgi:hypothetical protein
VPAISKQTRTKKSKALTGAAARIVPTSSLTKGVKLLAYGRGKTGKTRLFATFPKPALILGTEDGTSSISDVEGVDFLFLQKSTEVDEVVSLVQDGQYASVGLDTAGGLQDLILKEVLDLDEIPIQKTWGIARKQDWGTVGIQFKERMRNLLNLADQDLANVMVIAHERNFSEDSSEELMTPTVGAALTPGAAGWLNGACDYVCQTFIREETKTTTKKVAGKSIKQTKKTGNAEYCLRIGPHPVYLTGFRVSHKITDLPDCIVDPSYDKIKNVIEGN